MSTRDLLIAGALFALMLGNVPSLFDAAWSFRYAIVIAAVLPGTVALVALAAVRDRAAWFALAFVAVCIVSAAVSPSPRMAFLGYWGAGTSVPMFVGSIALWAVGRFATDRLRELLPAILAIGLGINVVVGVLQVVLEIDGGPLATINGRASGFLANAVYFGALMAGFAACCTASAIRSSSRVWFAGCAVFGFGTGLSGSRIAVIALAAVSLGLVVGWRSVRAALAAGCSVVGLAVATLFTTSTSSTSTVQRFVTKRGDGRSQLWRFASQAFADRPLLGWGPGNHTQATRPHYTLAFTRDFAQDEILQAWSDPHNVVLHVLVATGALGLICLIGFVVSQLGRVADLPLTAMAAAVVIAWMAEPVHIATLPITMLVLGIAIRRPARAIGSTVWRHAASAGALVGALLMAAIVVVDHRFDAARMNNDIATMEDVTGALFDDPRLTAVVGDTWTLRWSFSGTDADAAAALRWTRLAAERDPGNGFRWAELARRQVGMQMYDDARASLDRAFQLHPWSPIAWQVEYVLAVETGDEETERTAVKVVCDLELQLCPAAGASSAEAVP